MPILGSFGAGSGRGFGRGGAGFKGLIATGGTITEDGDFRIHTFTGPGTFSVSELSSDPAYDELSYLVVAGGGGGGSGAGGAGGFRENKSAVDTYTASPLNGATPITATVTGYPITVGGGGGSYTTGSPSIFYQLQVLAVAEQVNN